MPNLLRVQDTDSYITWVKGSTKKDGQVLHFTVRNKKGEPIARAKLTAEQLHKYICLHNTME